MKHRYRRSKKSTAVAATTLVLSTFVASSEKILTSLIPSTCIKPSYLKPNYSQISSITRGGANNSNDDKIVDDIIQQNNPYSILGVSRNSSSSDIQRAYRRRAVITHPDKRNGDRRAFDKVSEAYNVLNDDNSRCLYDKTGTMDPQKQQEKYHLNEQDVLRQFFFGEDIGINQPFGSPFGQHSNRQLTKKNKNVQYRLEVTLGDLYNGINHSMSVGTKSTKKTIDIAIQKGMRSGQTIVLPGTVEDIPNAPPGDRIFIVHQKNHKVFKRKVHDLLLDATISWKEAICGFERTLWHLDGRNIKILGPVSVKNEPMIVKSGDVNVIKGEGMPKQHIVSVTTGSGLDNDILSNLSDTERCEQYGDLYVQYQVESPSSKASIESLTIEERKELGRLLDKLEGKSFKKKQLTSWNIESSLKGLNKEYEYYNLGHSSKPMIRKTLQTAKISDFGVATGPFVTNDENTNSDIPIEEGENINFPHGRQTFFRQSSNGGTHTTYSFGSSSGFGPRFSRTTHMSDMGEDGEDVQCRQM